MNESTGDEFGRIYRSSEWRSRSRSGPGSLPELNAGYLQVLRDIIANHNITSIVDIGCGDWTLYQSCFDWNSINASYVGLDVVQELVDHLNSVHGRHNVEFRCLDVLGTDLPAADLYILKDVLQHWPNDRVAKFLLQLKHCRFALITNDIAFAPPGKRLIRKLLWFRRFKNVDTSIGGYRPLRLREPPFNLPARLLLKYSMNWDGWSFDKETLLYGNDLGK